jgi:signal transduction histidine kinase
MLLMYRLGPWSFPEATHPWVAATGQTSILISSALFLGSLSPLHFRVGGFNVLYAVPFAIPPAIYAILFYGVFHGVIPTGPLFLVFPGLGLLAFITVLFWGKAKSPAGTMPFWVGFPTCVLLGGLCLWVCFANRGAATLTAVECGSHLMTALLLIFVFRRFSPGMFLSVFGFTAWSLSILEIFPSIGLNPELDLDLIRIIVMAKVVAAMGMILLTLEDELAIKKAAQEREHRARLELEAYTNLILSRRRLEDFDHQATEICQTVVKHSRFAQAALLLLQRSGRYCVAGAAGMDAATVTALDTLAARIPIVGFLSLGSGASAVDHSQTLKLDLTPWLRPGDDLKRLHFTAALATPMPGRSVTEGAMLLAGMRASQSNPWGQLGDPLRADDLIPVEMLTARLQSVRSQTMMLEKLIDSEKFAGLGQLAGNVTQQLNNPLTVILGYASLLEETPDLDAKGRKGVQAILAEARRMRSTLESLSRISRTQGDQLAAVSVSELLADLEQLHRSDFLHRSIEFHLDIAPALPRAVCHAHQVRQAVLHCLQFAIEAVESQGLVSTLAQDKIIRLEATAEGNHVQILVAHSGPGFIDAEHAFDPFTPAQTSGETAGLGLSLCATILRDNNGRASAINLEPRGAAIILELQAA